MKFYEQLEVHEQIKVPEFMKFILKSLAMDQACVFKTMAELKQKDPVFLELIDLIEARATKIAHNIIIVPENIKTDVINAYNRGFIDNRDRYKLPLGLKMLLVAIINYSAEE